MVDKNFLDCIVFQFNRDDHGVILLVINTMEVIVCEGDGRHAVSMVGVGYMVDGLEVAKMFLFGRRGRASTSEAAKDSVNGAT